MELKEIKKHWEESGKQFSKQNRITPTSRDPFLGLSEEKKIIQNLKNNWVVLEIGCGDASHTVRYAKHVKIVYALDIAESLIYIAKKKAHHIKNIHFSIGSALNIKNLYQNKKFDCIISQRCLINLPSWQYQREVIKQSYKLLKKGGIFLITEGFQEELDNLNNVRKEVRLKIIKTVKYNKNLNQKKFESFIQPYFKILKVEDYGFYLFFSRIFHPLLVWPNQPKHDSQINEILFKLSQIINTPGFKKYSYNLFYILQKEKLNR